MQKKYEVTIPYHPGPWYTGYTIAETAKEAIETVKKSAISQGFWGRAGKPTAEVVQ